MKLTCTPGIQLPSLLLLSLLYFGICGHAQKTEYNRQENFLNANKVWAFPNSAGIDFNNGGGIGIGTAMTSGGFFASYDLGAASVCDPVTGKLLFYSNGATCWNAEHKVMPNGTNLVASSFQLAVQGAVIVPFVEDENKYYLFSHNYDRGLLFYSIVDMTLDNGKGDIMPNFKNVALNALDTTHLSHAMIAVPGNNCDVWLIVHEAYNPVYRSYNISATGLNPIPVVSRTSGTIMPPSQSGTPNFYLPGSMVVSPNRALIAMATNGFGIQAAGGLTLARFDANSGKISEEVQIGASWATSGTSVAISPDNSKLYLVDNDDVSLVQYDISNFDTTSINASKYWVTGISTLTYLRLYNDTIYCGLDKQNFLNRAC